MRPERYCILALTVMLSACATREPADGPPDRGSGSVNIPDAVPRDEPRSRYGNHSPYKVNGKTYHVMNSGAGYTERGVASWYGKKFHGRKTSSGETYDMYAMTAAHKALPLPTYVEVTNIDNGRRIVVKVNDRGPFVHNRIIDLSYGAASKLGIIGTGTAFVEVRAIDAGSRADPRRSGITEATPEPDPVDTHGEPAGQHLFIQVGAFAEYDNAMSMLQRLMGYGFKNTRLVETNVNGRELYRVRIGPVSSVGDHDALIRRLHRAGVNDTHLVSGD